MPAAPPVPSFADIEAAAKRIAPFAVATPLLEHPALNERVGRRVLLKLENLQRTGSFKFRGAFNRIALIPEADRAKGVLAFSSGNHAQGVAAAARLLGLNATIVMPSDAPRAKIEGTRKLGAAIVEYDRAKDDREAIAARLQAETGATLVKPFDDPFVVAGQGTIGLEIAQTAAARGISLDGVFVPCSGGGLVSGIALAIAGTSRRTKVYSVEPQNFEGMKRSLECGERTAAPGGKMSMADALMSPVPGHTPFAIAKERLAGGVSVSDAELAHAVSFAFRRLKIVAEPGGAAGLAAVLAGKTVKTNGAIALVISGGNCDPETVASCCAQVPDP